MVGGGRKRRSIAFVGVCQKVPSLSLTLDGLGLKITIDFSGAGELETTSKRRSSSNMKGFFLLLSFSLILSFFRSWEKKSR